MEAFWLSMGMIFLAELGDKTQLVALTLACRYNVKTVVWGVFCGTVAVYTLSTAIGWLIGGLLPVDWIKFIAGLAFISFGFWTLRGDCLEEDETGACRRIASPFWLVFVTFFLAELGDKTMLSAVTLAATYNFILVWAGSIVGMIFSDGLAIIVGRVMGARLPEKAIRIGAAVIFFIFGVISMFQGGGKFPLYIWAIGIVIVAILGFLSLRPRTAEQTAKCINVSKESSF